jgi:response regulator NasT
MAGEGEVRKELGAGSALIVCGKQEFGDGIAALLLGDGFRIVEIALSASDARRKLAYLEPDLVIASLPLTDDPGLRFILDLPDMGAPAVVALIRPETLKGMQIGIEQAGALILPKPVSRTVLKQTVRYALGARRSIEGLRKEREGLRKQIDERRVIEKAKWLMIRHLGITEPEAHRALQKRAMDERRQQLAVAQDVIKHYDGGNEGAPDAEEPQEP